MSLHHPPDPTHPKDARLALLIRRSHAAAGDLAAVAADEAIRRLPDRPRAPHATAAALARLDAMAGDLAGHVRILRADSYRESHRSWAEILGIPPVEPNPERIMMLSYANLFGHSPRGFLAAPAGRLAPGIVRASTRGDRPGAEGIIREVAAAAVALYGRVSLSDAATMDREALFDLIPAGLLSPEVRAWRGIAG